jgi:hypothetical protein
MIPNAPGTTVNVAAMEFSTPAPTRAPATASVGTPPPVHRGVYGGYLQNAQGEDVGASIHDMVPLAELETIDT